ncbi:MAG: helix-turn-helix domain-containing protein [Clostridia bacterium]|nr:helix-turn-helix domain-containing protein [Clostridia bacterium]
MRIFAIQDDSLPNRVLGYLIYYELQRAFYIELPEDADMWETPLLLSSFIKQGLYSIGSNWSRMWVQQRIIPQDRQNIVQILKENGLKEYDAFQLLMLAKGRCAQDDCYLEEVNASVLSAWLLKRWETKIEDVTPLHAARLLIFFRNGDTRIADIQTLTPSHPECRPYIAQPSRFSSVEVQPDGYGVMWSDRAMILHHELYAHSMSIPLTLDDFRGFVQHRLASASEACQLLDCSRQNIDDLMRRGKLHPVRQDSKYKLFLRNEILQRRRT